MTTQPALADVKSVRRSLARALAERDGDDTVAPIRAGMRARAIADACERLALPAILIDKTGRVLHVGDSATLLLGEDSELQVSAGHLVGRDRAHNEAVQQAVTDALGEGQGTRRGNGRGLCITGLRYRDASPYQRLGGVLVLSRPGQGRVAGLASLRTLLAA